MWIPLRDRDDLPEDIARILSVRRHRGNQWTEEDALAVARFCGYEPQEPWPGAVGVLWKGTCILGHTCSPTLSHLLSGRRPCGKTGHSPAPMRPPGQSRRPGARDRRKANEEVLLRVAAERGDVILEMAPKPIKGGMAGMIRAMCLTVRYACGHESGPLAIHASNYKRPNAGGCGQCNPSRVIPGVNTLDVLRPDLARDLVDQTLASRVAPGGWTKVEWRCKDCGHIWKATLGSRAYLDSGCPECNGAGYNESAAGTLYVVQGISVTTRETLIKVGISNTPEKRLYNHAKQGLEQLLSRITWSDGAVAPVVERRWVLGVRKAMPDYLKAKKADLPDGYREAVIDTDESRLAIHAFLLEAQATGVEVLTDNLFDPEVFLPRVR